MLISRQHGLLSGEGQIHMPEKDQQPTDYRKLQRDHDRQNLSMVLFVLVIIGGLLVGIVYSPGSILGALPWLFLGACGVLGLYGLWLLIERILRR